MGNASSRAAPPSTLDTVSQYRTFLLEYSHQSAKLVYVQFLGDGKFLKSIHCKCDGGSVVVKIYRKVDADEDLSKAEASIRKLFHAFTIENQPNVLPYADFQLSTKSDIAFLVRQYFLSNLADRYNTRPFLSTIEKKWIAFQLLRAVEQCHGTGICHGDIKAENIMITSWNWIFLTDFAPFKPTYLPEDDPSEYNYYFRVSDKSRNSCTVSPERFYSSSSVTTKGPDAMFLSTLADSTTSLDEVTRHVDMMSKGNSQQMTPAAGKLRQSMDIFSLGCVIGEIFSNGKPIFDLPTLLKYRTGDDSALETIHKIKDQRVRDLVLHMIQRNGRARLSAIEYRKQSTGPGQLFPEYFDTFMYRFMNLILSRGARVADARIRLVCKYYGRILKEVTDVEDPEGSAFFHLRLREGYGADKGLKDNLAQRVYKEIEETLVSSGEVKQAETYDDEADIDAIADKTNQMKLNEASEELDSKRFQDRIGDLHKKSSDLLGKVELNDKNSSEVPKEVNDDNTTTERDDDSSGERKLEEITSLLYAGKKPKFDDNQENGIVLVLSLLCSSLRHTRFPQSRVTALQLITRLSLFTDDQCRVQRLVPYIMELLDDPNAIIRAQAIRSLTFVLGLIEEFSLSDGSLFPKFIFPSINRFPSDPEEMVRIAFAECLPKIAECSRHFLDLKFALRIAESNQSKDPTLTSTASMSMASFSQSKSTKSKSKSKNKANNFSYDFELGQLHQLISRLVIQIAAPDQKASSSGVKRALLQDIVRLCIFFGRERTLDMVLPQLITVLNDRNWELRANFFSQIVGVAAFIGRVSLEMYILPCIEQALIDVHENVIASALHCLATLCELGLFEKHALIEKASTTACLLLHPGYAIREAVTRLFVAISRQFDSKVDCFAFLGPIIRPYIVAPMVFSFDIEENIERVLRSPVSRESFDTALIASEEESRERIEDIEFPVDMNGTESFVAVQKDDQLASSELDGPGSYNSVGSSILSQDTGKDEEPSSMVGSGAMHQYRSGVAEEKEKLRLMKNYIEVASLHMRSKLQLARSEHAQRLLHGDEFSKFTSYGSNISNKYLQTLRVPDMRFALLHAPPLRLPSNVMKDFTISSRIESLSMPYLIRMFGLQAVSTSAKSVDESQNPVPKQASTLRHESMFGEVIIPFLPLSAPSSPLVSKQMKKTHGYGNNEHLVAAIRASPDPALLDSHKLRSRVVSLDIPPLPPDLGALQTFSGARNVTNFSIYSVPHGISGGIGHLSSATNTSLSGSVNDANPIMSLPVEVCYRNWRPKEGVLVGQLSEHASAVNRLVVPQDFSFFGSGSNDGKIKIWSARGLVHGINHISKYTYHEQQGRIMDMTMCDNSHSIASASSDGSVHVFRVDTATTTSIRGNSTTLNGFSTAQVRKVNTDKESVVAVDHLNNITESLLIYATKRGEIYGWDLRFRRNAFHLKVPLELGYVTCMTHGTDCIWLACGTSRGYITVWDLRFHLLVKIWRHSSYEPIHRMSPCMSIPPNQTSRPPNTQATRSSSVGRYSSRKDSSDNSSSSNGNGMPMPKLPLIYVAAGANELAIFDISIGACRSLFRTLSSHVSSGEETTCPGLEHVPIPISYNGEMHSSVLGTQAYVNALESIDLQATMNKPVIRAILTPSLHLRGVPDSVLTAGDDRQIRYWDLRNPKKSFTVSSIAAGETKSFYDSQNASEDWWQHSLSPVATPSFAGGKASYFHSASSDSISFNLEDTSYTTRMKKKYQRLSPPTLYFCQDSSSIAKGPSSASERRGPVAPSPNHKDCILDIKLIDVQVPMILSSGRDGLIKIWR